MAQLQQLCRPSKSVKMHQANNMVCTSRMHGLHTQRLKHIQWLLSVEKRVPQASRQASVKRKKPQSLIMSKEASCHHAFLNLQVLPNIITTSCPNPTQQTHDAPKPPPYCKPPVPLQHAKHCCDVLFQHPAYVMHALKLRCLYILMHTAACGFSTSLAPMPPKDHHHQQHRHRQYRPKPLPPTLRAARWSGRGVLPP
jgi:hypothetical protein